MKFIQYGILLGVVLAVTASSSMAAVISVDFTGNKQDGFGSDNNAVLQNTHVAGLEAVDNWVSLTGTNQANASIGNGATVSFGAAWTFDTDSAATADTDPNAVMMDGGIRVGGPGDSPLTVSNLGTDFTAGGYKVIVYIGSDDNDNGGRFHRLTITDTDGNIVNRAGRELINPAYDGSFVEASEADGIAGNYLVFDGLSGSGFTISDNGTSPGRAGVPGFQIVSVPEPATMCLLAVGGVGILARRKRNVK